MSVALAIVGSIFLLGGTLFSVIGGIGLIRLPDFYSRGHAAGMTDSAGAGGVLVGLCFFAEPLVAVKLLTVVGFIWLSSVVSTHALVKAAYARGVRLQNPRVRDWTLAPPAKAESQKEGSLEALAAELPTAPAPSVDADSGTGGDDEEGRR